MAYQLSTITVLAFLGCVAAVSGAYAQQNVPGGFSEGEKSLTELIEFPELRGDANVTISCLALLETNGKLDKHGCYVRNPGDETFVAAIYKAVKKARLVPAVYDGRPTEVVFQYRAQFVQQGEEKEINFVANPGYTENVEAYGHEHIAAQRLFQKETWNKACPQHAKFIVLVKANVDYDGTPAAASVADASGLPITEKCRQAILDDVLNSRFIPAMADGEAVPSTFVEPFGN